MTKTPWAQTIRRASGLVEHICEHGVGHPAAGSVHWMELNTGDDGHGVHGCDGCCNTMEWKLADAVEGFEVANELLSKALKTIRELRA